MHWRAESHVPVDRQTSRHALARLPAGWLAEIESKALRGHEPELLAIPAQSLVGVQKGSGRDLRIDVCRGIALWCIFLDHIPNNIGSWLTLRNYGFRGDQLWRQLPGYLLPRRPAGTCRPDNTD